MEWEYGIGEATTELGSKKKRVWKYFVWDKEVDSRSAILESFGNDGYELVSVSTFDSSHRGYGNMSFVETVKEIFYFNRPLKE